MLLVAIVWHLNYFMLLNFLASEFLFEYLESDFEPVIRFVGPSSTVKENYQYGLYRLVFSSKRLALRLRSPVISSMLQSRNFLLVLPSNLFLDP